MAPSSDGAPDDCQEYSSQEAIAQDEAAAMEACSPPVHDTSIEFNVLPVDSQVVASSRDPQSLSFAPAGVMEESSFQDPLTLTAGLRGVFLQAPVPPPALTVSPAPSAPLHEPEVIFMPSSTNVDVTSALQAAEALMEPHADPVDWRWALQQPVPVVTCQCNCMPVVSCCATLRVRHS